MNKLSLFPVLFFSELVSIAGKGPTQIAKMKNVANFIRCLSVGKYNKSSMFI